MQALIKVTTNIKPEQTVNGAQFLVLTDGDLIMTNSVRMNKNPIAKDSTICREYDDYNEAYEAYLTLISGYVSRGDWSIR